MNKEIEKAIESLKNNRFFDEGVKELAITALEAQQADAWIPISSGRLPENESVVLVTDGRDYQPIYCVALMINGEWRVSWNHDKFGSVKIAYWKPITPIKEV